MENTPSLSDTNYRFLIVTLLSKGSCHLFWIKPQNASWHQGIPLVDRTTNQGIPLVDHEVSLPRAKDNLNTVTLRCGLTYCLSRMANTNFTHGLLEYGNQPTRQRDHVQKCGACAHVLCTCRLMCTGCIEDKSAYRAQYVNRH